MALTMRDVLAAQYRVVAPEPEAVRADTGLLLIDIQHLASADHLHTSAVAAGLPEDEVRAALADFRARFDAAVSNCAQLLAAARAAGITPVHVRIEALAGDARDTGSIHARMGWKYPPGSAQSKFIPAVAPAPGQIVISKTCSGAFTSTALDPTLRNMGIRHLWICGFMTDECIEASTRAALDLGYLARVVGDATTTYDQASWAAVTSKYASFGILTSTERTLARFRQMLTVAGSS